MPQGLTVKQQTAIAHYAIHRDKLAAYVHAYGRGASKPTTVERNAHAMFAAPLVAEALRAMTAYATAATGIDAAWVLRRLALLADFSLAKFTKVSDSGKPYYDFRDATPDDWYCLEELTVDSIAQGQGDDTYTVDRVRLKASSRLKALELLGKHVAVQAFSERVEHTGSVGVVTMTVDEYKAARAEMLAADDV